MARSDKTEVRLDYTPRAWQRECHRQRSRFRVLALHRRAGKTELAIMELVDAALRCKLDLGLFVYLSPFYRQSRAIAWARLKAKLEPLRLTGAIEINEGDSSVQFLHNGATVRIFGGDNPDSLRGLRLDGIVIDEVAQVRPEVWQDVVQPALSDRRGWALFIGTPSGVNLFSELFYKAQATPDWHGARYTVHDTEAIAKDEVDRLRRDMSEASFAREYLCDFTAAGDDQLISLMDAEEAARRTITPQQVEGLAKVIGVDPARFGDDRSVICRRQGLCTWPFIALQGLDNMELAARVANVIEEWEPDAVFIDAGAGSGLIDRLRQLRYDIIEVPFGGRATQPALYTNRRTEMWWEMAQWVRGGGAIPNDSTLKQELATPVYWYDPQGRKVLESKDEIKKRLQGGSSPDLADALALTFAHPVRANTPRNIFESLSRRERRTDYDPYAEV